MTAIASGGEPAVRVVSSRMIWIIGTAAIPIRNTTTISRANAAEI